MSEIFEPIVTKIGAVSGVTGVYPVGHIVDGESVPYVCYSFGTREAARDLSGNVHHYTDNVDIVIFAESYDDAHRIQNDIAESMLTLMNTEHDDQFIFSAELEANGDGYSSDLELTTKSATITIRWCNVE